MPVTSLNQRILIIDDNRQIHGDFAKILGASPAVDDALASAEAALFGTAPTAVDAMPGRLVFTLRSAYQGEDGAREIEAALARGEPYALAFVDMRMPPGWDGLKTIAKIWEVDPDVQIVLCTAFSDYSWSELTAKLGYSDRLLILKKPFDILEVLQLAHALTEKWAMAQALKLHVAGLGILVEERTRELQLANTSLGHEVARHQTTIRELAAVRQRIEEVLRTVPLVLIGVGADGVITHWNAIAESTFALPRAEALGRQLSSLPIAWPIATVLSLAADARGTGSAAECEIRIDGGEGRQHAFLMLSAAAMPAPSADVLVYGSDVTKRKLIEIHLVNSQKLEAVGQLAAGIAHEINTPTQYIGDNARFLQESFQGIAKLLHAYRELAAAAAAPAPGKTGEFAALLERIDGLVVSTDAEFLAVEIPKALEQSIEGLDQISKIVSAMRDFSRQDHGTRMWADINASIQSTVNVARSEYKYVADVVLELDPLLPKISCCASEINQVLLNIVVNAAHAIRDSGMKRRGTIRVSTESLGSGGKDGIEIRIADDGPGIPAAIQSRVYEPFFTTKPVGKGTGQGLYLSRNIVVKGHGGSLTFTSPDGGPTTFVIRLPIAKPAASGDAIAAD